MSLQRTESGPKTYAFSGEIAVSKQELLAFKKLDMDLRLELCHRMWASTRASAYNSYLASSRPSTVALSRSSSADSSASSVYSCDISGKPRKMG